MDRNLIPLDFNFRETSYRSRFSGDFLSRIRTSSGEFHELRPYVSGESGVRVDYRRSDFEEGRLVVREYLQEQSFELCIIIFVDPAWRFGTDTFTKFDILSMSIRCLAVSVWERDIVGSFLFVSNVSGMVQEYPFPRDLAELKACLRFLQDMLFQSEKPTSNILIEEILHAAAVRSEQVAYCIFSENIPLSALDPFVNRHQVANIIITHPQEERILGGKWIKRDIRFTEGGGITVFGCQIILDNPVTARDSIQRGFDIW